MPTHHSFESYGCLGRRCPGIPKKKHERKDSRGLEEGAREGGLQFHTLSPQSIHNLLFAVPEAAASGNPRGTD